MSATVEMVTVETLPCRACGRQHRLRLALVAADPSDQEITLGFFGRCPDLGQKSWMVIAVPMAADGASRLLRMGPPDQDRWEPDDLESIRRAVAVDAVLGRRPSTRPAPPPPCPRPGDGYRRIPVPDLLRRALGCPMG